MFDAFAQLDSIAAPARNQRLAYGPPHRFLASLCALQVRAAGGLRVIVASLPDTRRSELQLRGRSGRWAAGRPAAWLLPLGTALPALCLWQALAAPKNARPCSASPASVRPAVSHPASY